MKAAPLFIFLLASGLCFSQYQNRPELTAPLLQAFAAEADSRGVEVSERLVQLDSLKVEFTDDLAGAVYYWRGNVDGIKLRPDVFDSGKEKSLFILMHEVGHLFGVEDCFECTYNVMSANFSERAVFLTKDPYLKKWLFDNYFQRIKDPSAPHIHY